jgi:hypothetical protein
MQSSVSISNKDTKTIEMKMMALQTLSSNKKILKSAPQIQSPFTASCKPKNPHNQSNPNPNPQPKP